MTTHCCELRNGFFVAIILFLGSRVALGEPTFILQPVSSTGPYSIAGTEIRIPRGGVEVELELLVCGWGDAMGAPNLGGYSATFYTQSFAGANAIPPNPGVDLTIKGNNVFVGSGLFIVTSVCSVSGSPCYSSHAPPLGPCAPVEGICVPNDRVVCNLGFFFSPIVPFTNLLGGVCGDINGAANILCNDASSNGYAGTIILNIPPQAVGTYSIELVDSPNHTYMVTPDVDLIQLLLTIPCLITILDCNANGVADGLDIDSSTSADCNGNDVPDDCEPDADDDGVPDGCDACPADPNKIEPGNCGCGVAETGDSDGDSYDDCVDLCPGVDDDIYFPGCVGAIPTVSSWGVLIMALLLLSVIKASPLNRSRT